jgi:hypothetical protein
VRAPARACVFVPYVDSQDARILVAGEKPKAGAAAQISAVVVELLVFGDVISATSSGEDGEPEPEPCDKERHCRGTQRGKRPDSAGCPTAGQGMPR